MILIECTPSRMCSGLTFRICLRNILLKLETIYSIMHLVDTLYRLTIQSQYVRLVCEEFSYFKITKKSALKGQIHSLFNNVTLCICFNFVLSSEIAGCQDEKCCPLYFGCRFHMQLSLICRRFFHFHHKPIWLDIIL